MKQAAMMRPETAADPEPGSAKHVAVCFCQVGCASIRVQVCLLSEEEIFASSAMRVCFGEVDNHCDGSI